jgi:tripartite-type tricarboxylate transporter receptor subunit TctC
MIWTSLNCAAASLLLGGALLQPSEPRADEYPSRPVTVVLPAAVGGGPDVIARILAERLSQSWKQPVVILNRPGGTGIVGAQAMVNAKPDGYLLYLPVASNFTVLAQTQDKLPIDFGRDIRPVGLVGEQPMVIAVASSLGVKTLGDLLALARQRPGQLTYGMTRGSLPHMTMEMVRLKAGVDLTFVPYTATQQVISEVQGNRIAVTVDAMSALAAAHERAAIRLLAVASSARLADYPDVPTVAETLPRFEARGWFALMAPTGTPDNVVEKLNRDLRTVLENEELQQRFRILGTYVRPMSPTQLAEFIRQEQELWLPVVKKIAAMQ